MSKNYVNKIPKISRKYPFDYEHVVQNAMYGFMSNMFCSQKGRPRPLIVMKEDREKSIIEGFEIETYNDGLKIHGEFSIPIDSVPDNTYLTGDVHTLICSWLESQGDNYLKHKHGFFKRLFNPKYR